MAAQSLRSALKVYTGRTTRSSGPACSSTWPIHWSTPRRSIRPTTWWRRWKLYEAVLEARDRDTDPLGRARVLANQGNVLGHLGAFDQAKAKLYEARFIFEEFRRPRLDAHRARRARRGRPAHHPEPNRRRRAGVADDVDHDRTAGCRADFRGAGQAKSTTRWRHWLTLIRDAARWPTNPSPPSRRSTCRAGDDGAPDARRRRRAGAALFDLVDDPTVHMLLSLHGIAPLIRSPTPTRCSACAAPTAQPLWRRHAGAGGGRHRVRPPGGRATGTRCPR